jgi:hypothetical protein
MFIFRQTIMTHHITSHQSLHGRLDTMVHRDYGNCRKGASWSMLVANVHRVHENIIHPTRGMHPWHSQVSLVWQQLSLLTFLEKSTKRLESTQEQLITTGAIWTELLQSHQPDFRRTRDVECHDCWSRIELIVPSFDFETPVTSIVPSFDTLPSHDRME